jgi:hypothetical protein
MLVMLNLQVLASLSQLDGQAVWFFSKPEQT